MLDAFSGQQFSLKLATHRLLSGDSVQVILSYFDTEQVLEYQLISRKLYDVQVPKYFFRIQIPLIIADIYDAAEHLKSALFEIPKDLELLYTGSENEFLAEKFHELCDD